LRAKRSNPALLCGYGLLRRCAPRNDEIKLRRGQLLRREAPPDDRLRDLSTVAQRAKAEAIHSGHPKGGLLRRGACHRARIRATRWLLAMTDRKLRFECQTADTRPHSRGGRRPRFACRRPSNWREQGMPDARCTRGPVCKRQNENRTRAYRAAEAIRHSLRNGFTAYFALSPEYRAFLPPSPHGNRHSGPVGLSHLR